MPTLLPFRAPERVGLPATMAGEAPPDPPRHAMRRRLAVPAALLALLALGGCKLIDQTTFAPAPAAAPPQRTTAMKPDARTPLLIIGPDTPVSGYRTLLGFAVHAAEQRDRTVRFDVTAVAAAGLPPIREAAETAAAEAEATRVMRAMAEAGVPADRILLRAVLDPATSRHEVRVYVR
ncbi:MAG: hypothetical protein ACREFY_03825 [Acetobacteraceae bacterium]